MPDNDLQSRAEDLWRKLNPHPEGSYAWYGWSLDFTVSDDGQISPVSKMDKYVEYGVPRLLNDHSK